MVLVTAPTLSDVSRCQTLLRPHAAELHRKGNQIQPRGVEFFQKLPRRERRNFVVWIHIAKRPETRERRIRESIALLAAGRKLGLK
jgi:uncharacterized protein YdeI (YjbR/CyaY-like superfamily)